MENAAAAQAGSAYKARIIWRTSRNVTSLLVVDDNEDNLNIIRTIFEDCSFSMDCVKSAKEALELLEKSSYDIIILDVMMPEMSGFELCQIIRKRYLTSNFRCFCYRLRWGGEIPTGFWSGANDYVVKPADWIGFRTRVFSLITLKQSVKSALDNEMLFLQAQIRPHFCTTHLIPSAPSRLRTASKPAS
ncbi:MAG: response regulator [[Clostridium] scindens]